MVLNYRGLAVSAGLAGLAVVVSTGARRLYESRLSAEEERRVIRGAGLAGCCEDFSEEVLSPSPQMALDYRELDVPDSWLDLADQVLPPKYL